jgi:hypothetical protein
MRLCGMFRTWATMLVATTMAAACGGGGGAEVTPAVAVTAAQAPAASSSASADQAIAEQLYAGTPRVPADFYMDSTSAGATGSVATTHLKNTDLGAASNAQRYELCTDDMAQAIEWSETRATFQGGYADLVETNTSSRMWELVRVPRNDVTARLRHRVFKCGYLDRAGSDLGMESGPAGTLKELPVSTAQLRTLVEYLWQFTAFNNADHVVLRSYAGGDAGGTLTHTLEMARLTRGALAGECDRIDVLRWTHSAAVASGALQRRLDTAQSFRARRDNGVVQLCTG